jgi:type I site-specific restriction-modification system R (restriction) subunit
MEVKQTSNLRNKHIIVIANRVDLAMQIYLQISAIMSQDNTCEVVIPASAKAVVEALNSQEPKIVISTYQKFITDTFFFDKDCLLVAYNAYLLSESIKVSLPNATHILFTSSPPQLDTRFMINFGEIVSKYDFKQAVNDGIVMPIRIEKRIPDLNLDNPSFIATEFEKLEEPDLEPSSLFSMNAVIDRHDRISFLSKDIVNHFRLRQKNFLGKGIVVVSDIQSGVAYSQAIANINGDADFVEAISSKTSAEQRELLIKKFLKQDDPLCILVVTSSFLEGMDNPLIHTIYVTSPVSLPLGYQLAGLVSRLSPGKEDALIVDYVGLNLYLDDLFDGRNTSL